MTPTAGQTPRLIALIGLSGTGKSTVGRLLAARLGWPLRDTDALIVAQARCAIADIFASGGEERFRDLEAAALHTALARAPAVIATGAGIVQRPANRALLRDHALVVWLDAPTATLVARLDAHNEARPLLGTAGARAARLEALRAARADLYAALADLRVLSHEIAPDAVCELILAQVQQTMSIT